MNTLPRRPLLPTILSSLATSNRASQATQPAALLTLTTQRGLKEVTAFRRHRKLLNIPPAPEFTSVGAHAPTGSSARSRLVRPSPPSSSLPSHSSRIQQQQQPPPPPTHGTHITFNPPSSAPNVYHTPAKFLPRSDIRARLPLPASLSGSSSSTPLAKLPPPLSTPYAKSYSLTPTQIESLRALRRENEDYWTRSRLAEKFGCSSLFVGMVVQASKRKVEAHQRSQAMQRGNMGGKRRAARIERERRKETWGRDE